MARVALVSVAVLLLAVPAAAASHLAPLDVMHVTALAEARWTDAEGRERVGALGDGTYFLTVEDVATLAHPDMDQCYGQGYTSVSPAPPVEGPNNGLSPFAGHGTWTAAAVCSTGEASAGHFRGLAPGAKVLTYLDVLDDPQKRELQQRMLAEFRPIVLTSSLLEPPERRFAALDGADLLVTWAAGNEGGDGGKARTRDDIGDPRFLIVAAAHWDASKVADYSSRGAKDDPATWPHLAAVGCHVVPLPYTQPGGFVGFASPLVDQPTSCPEPSLEMRLAMLAGSYRLIDGTSFAAPSVAAVLALMQQVHPAIRPMEARELVLGTTDVFLPTADQDGDGAVGRHDFWLQHGFEAGRGLLNATAAVAAAHYLGLHAPAGADVAEALRCGSAVDEGDALRLNPGGRCPPSPPPSVVGTTTPSLLPAAAEPSQAGDAATASASGGKPVPGLAAAWLAVAAVAAAMQRRRAPPA